MTGVRARKADLESWPASAHAVLHQDQIVNRSRDPVKFPSSRAAVAPIYTGAIGRWRKDLTAIEAQTVQELPGPLLAELGSVGDAAWVGETANER